MKEATQKANKISEAKTKAITGGLNIKLPGM